MKLPKVGFLHWASTGDFRLLRYFTSASLVAFVVVAVLLGYIFRSLSIDGLLSGYESEHVNHASIIANEMWDDDFAPLVLAMADKSSTQLQSQAQIAPLHRKVQKLLKGTKIFKIKVYDLRGMTVYSTELQQIGEDKSKNKGVMDGLKGLNSSELVHRDQFSAFEGEVQNRDLVESYVPRYDPVSGKVSGVFEIYGDATAVLAEVGKRQWLMILSVVSLLALLFVALSIIVKWAQGVITEQNREREKTRLALSQSEERWKFALEGAGDGVWDRNLVTGAVVYSKRYLEIYGYAENEVVSHGQEWEQHIHPDDLARAEAQRKAYLSGQQQSYANERRMRCRDGSWKWILSRGMVVARDAQGQPTRMIGTHTDITERKAMEARLQQLAHFDQLTGLPNRALFSDRLRQSLARARRNKRRLALMFIDLDEFKPVNDQLGHQVGDLLLNAVAQRLSDCVPRESDTVARLGGDEFVVMLSEIEQPNDALLVANKILQALSRIFNIGPDSIQISCCIGIAFFPEQGPEENQLIKAADAAMYRAKEQGGNRLELALNRPVTDTPVLN
jgi:diguanylate cyclase (GGDEF)-like protein/PAS domain S-box-containing protein